MSARRKALGLTQKQLAAIFYGISESEVLDQHQVQISRYETGRRWPDEEAFVGLAFALKCTVADLVTTPPEPANG